MTEPLWRRLLRLHRPDPAADVRDEFAFHLDERIEALKAKGLSEELARETALRQFGDLEQATAVCTEIGSRRAREVRRSERWWSVSGDLSYAFRGMRRWPGFTLAAVLTIALGIGVNATAFSLLNGLLLRPLDADRPGELVRIYTSEGHALRDDRDRFGASSYADHLDLRRSGALADLAAAMPLGATVAVDRAASRVEARVVSENYFSLLGRPLFLGGWTPEQNPNRGHEVIVSHRFWRTALGADPAPLGRPLLLNGHYPVVVAGVTAPAFRGIEPAEVDLYLPFEGARELLARPSLLTDRSERSVRLIGRLATGATAPTAERSLDGIMQALGAEYPVTNGKRVMSVRPARSIVPLELMGDAVIPIAALVFGATVVMLAISGVNLAAVLVARTLRRRRELAVRGSLGASPGRLIRQLITENLALAFVAGLLVTGLLSFLPSLAAALGIPPAIRPPIDLTVLGYTGAVAAAFGLVLGLTPALVGMHSAVVASLRDSDAPPIRARIQGALVSLQIALSMLLLLVSAALLASLDRQQRIDPGFQVEGLIVADFEDPIGRPDAARQRAFAELAVERLSGIPGVTSVALASMAPLTGDGMRSTIHIPGYVEQPDENMEVLVVMAGPDFFRTAGIPLLRGRELRRSDRDSAARVVVNQSMARRYWGESDPVGRFVRLGGSNGVPAEVIGVAADARFRSLAEPPQPMYTVQRLSPGTYSVLIRTRGDPAELLPAVQGSMLRPDVLFTLAGLHTMEEILRTSLSVSRAVSQTLLAMGLVAIVLAAVGLYGVVSYVMTGRAREFGVRLALGAPPGSVMRLVLRYGVQLALIGGGAGLVLGLGALRVIDTMLYGSWAFAPLGAVVGIGLSAVTLIACAVPALRATGTSPASVLRVD